MVVHFAANQMLCTSPNFMAALFTALLLLPVAGCPTQGPLVGVVGGGIGGTAVALALQQRGIRVTLMERDDNFDQRRPGYGVTLQQGVSALRKLGVLQECAAHDMPSSSHYVFEPNGSIVGFFGRAFTCTPKEPFIKEEGYLQTQVHTSQRKTGTRSQEEGGRWARKDGNAGKSREDMGQELREKLCGITGMHQQKVGMYNIHLPRQRLRRILMDKLHNGTVQWGCRVQDVREYNDGVRVFLKGGSVITVDVLIGADGIRSQVRRCLLGTQPRYLGVHAIFGMSKLKHPLLSDRVMQMNDGVNRLFCMPFSTGVTFWQLSFEDSLEEVRDSSMSPQKLIDAALERCGSWHSPVPEMIASSQLSDVSGHRVFDHEPVPPRAKCSGGTAGHGCTQHKGVGCAGKVLGDIEKEVLAPKSESHRSINQTDVGGEALGCCSRVILIGDASHAMAPFKAQGANQALLDAISVAQALSTAISRAFAGNLAWSSCARCEVLRCVEEEIYQRALKKVNESRRALLMLHSSKARNTSTFGFRGVQQHVISALKHRGIGAWSASGADLDCLVNEAIREVSQEIQGMCNKSFI